MFFQQKKNLFFLKNKVLFSSAIFQRKVFIENYRNKEAAAAAERPRPRIGHGREAAMASKRPCPRSGHGRNAAMAAKRPWPKKHFFCLKKAPVASRQLRKMFFFPKKHYFWLKKGARGKPPAGGKWFSSGPAGGKWFLTKMYFFTPKKKAPAATGQQEENGFGQKCHFWLKKSACGNGLAGGKWCFLKKHYFKAKKAPAAIGQPEEKGF